MYQVIDSAGNSYGSISIETLRQWVAENRLTPDMTIVDEASGARGPAGQLLAGKGIFPDAAPPMQARSAPAPVSYSYKGSTEPGMPPMLQTRAVAFFIDFMLGLMVYEVVQVLINILFAGIRSYETWTFWSYFGYFTPALVTLFFLLRDAFLPNGQSIGKRIAGLRVQSAGAPINAMHSILRNIVALPLFMLPIPYVGAWFALPVTVLLFLADAFMVMTSGKRLGDAIAHTQVVNA